MAPPRSGSKNQRQPPANRPAASNGQSRLSPLAQQLPLVSGRWLLWSLGGIFGGGLALVYLTMVLLFWQGQWQILFHPDRSEKPIPATINLPLEDVAFGTTETGQPLLDGWYIPGATDTQVRDNSKTILYLHSMQTGSLADALPALSALRPLGTALFALDYRGFGKSAFLHPSEVSTAADVEAAWQYLVDTRHIPAKSIVIYGVGLAGSLAAEAVNHHPEASALVMDQPLPAAIDLLRADPRSGWMPVSLLARDSFSPQAVLENVKQPKLFLLAAPDDTVKRYTTGAADPKTVVPLPVHDASQARLEALQHFLADLPFRASDR